MSHLAQIGKLHHIAGFTLLVTLRDQAPAGTVSAIADEATAEAAILVSRARGYLDVRSLAEVFTWLRPNDLIWNYWVNNYLQGKQPPAFDILYWNADTTRMTAALHYDFIRMAMNNALTRPARGRRRKQSGLAVLGELRRSDRLSAWACLPLASHGLNALTRPAGAAVLGTDVDLTKVSADSYIVAGIAHHICPWQSCYARTQLLGGTNRFVLSTDGHIAALVNPPGNPNSRYQTTADGQDNPPDPQEWLNTAKTEHGSWWPDYAGWLADRSGPERAAPDTLGGTRFAVLAAAPGSYVTDR